jgi:ATP-dependent NAD(P)H-hydrate dehydratase
MDSTFAQYVPDLYSASHHKGSCGRIGVVGGSPEYTGAPYYAGISALKFGADLTFVFAAKQAANAIKSYSPELMVVPVYDQDQVDETNSADMMVERVTGSFPRLHGLLVGCGLGRHPVMLSAVEKILACARDANLIVVLDADALSLLCHGDLAVVQGNRKVILTPNVVEYKRLWSSVHSGDGSSSSQDESSVGSPQDVELLAQKLGGVTVVLKSERDVVSNGTLTLICEEVGGRKRSGGQGDVLAGCIVTACAWSKSSVETLPYACAAACAVVKRASRKAFNKELRAMTAPDVIDQLGASFQSFFPTQPVDAKI